eukprot:239228-Rhodomonas_salina.1
MLRVVKESIAKRLAENDLSAASTDEAGSESESESTGPGFAAGHAMAAYNPGNIAHFRTNATQVLVAVRTIALLWRKQEDEGNERRHPLCATVLLDVLRHTRFKEEKHSMHADEWFGTCVKGNMCLSEDIIADFQSMIEIGSPPAELLNAVSEASSSSSNAKQHRICISFIDAAVRLLHQQSSWGDVAEWNRDVVDGWFTNASEGAISFLNKAEAYLRRYAEPENLDLKIVEGAVEKGSFVAFFLADRFTLMLVFAVAEYHRASSMARLSGEDAEKFST